MIDFLTPEVELRFHALPIDKQREWLDQAERYLERGLQLQILFVEQSDDGLEVAIRVNKKFDV
jgi:hypothetical protein